VSLEDDLRRIDHEIRKLKIEFDLYFIGANPKPPLDHRDSIDKELKKHQGTSMKNLGDRFLYNSIVNKFNAYQELWSKTMRVKEEGARVHPLAARHAQQSAILETGGTNGPVTGAVHAGRQRRRVSEPDSWRVPTDRADQGAVRELYDSFIAAKSRVGDSRRPSFDAFAREIARHAATLKGRSDCDAIDFKIYCKDNKVSLKAKPAR
jgi:hypothetical protein